MEEAKIEGRKVAYPYLLDTKGEPRLESTNDFLVWFCERCDIATKKSVVEKAESWLKACGASTGACGASTGACGASTGAGELRGGSTSAVAAAEGAAAASPLFVNSSGFASGAGEGDAAAAVGAAATAAAALPGWGGAAAASCAHHFCHGFGSEL